jgi:tungstate transport system permease protein
MSGRLDCMAPPFGWMIYGTCRIPTSLHIPAAAWSRGMSEFAVAFATALDLILSGDPTLMGIVQLSLAVSLSAVVLAAVLGLPLGALLALARFPGRAMALVLLNALMGLPPVVVGLVVYLLLSRSGPLGSLGLLFTATAMIVAQTVLVLPIIAAIARQVVEDLWAEYREQLESFGIGRLSAAGTLLWDGRRSLATAVLAGFGRASAEVGAVLIVGGNIAGHTRTMTTAIALETSKGDLALALGLGLVLMGLVMAVNAAAFGLSQIGH